MKLIVENEKGEKLNLTNNSSYIVTQITGLTPVNASINTTTMALGDGSVYNSSRLRKRNITMTIAPRKDIEKSRINLYQYIRTKRYIKIYITTKMRDVYIEGYVESMEGDLYEKPQKLMVSIICPNPYFKGIEKNVVNFSNVTKMFEFPFALPAAGDIISTLEVYQETNVHNESDSDTGVIFDLYARDTVKNPTIYNQTKNKNFSLECELIEGDHIIINTQKGKKSAKIIRNNEEINILNKIKKGSNWLTLESGDNIISYICDEGGHNLNIIITIEHIYEGV